MTGTSGGSNILRGGKRAYECKTLVGNYVEEAYRPNAITSSWSGGANYETSTKSQMATGIGITVKEFGGGLKKFEDRKYDYNQLIGADKTRSPSTWKTLTQSAHSGASQPTEFAAPREMKGRQLSPDELEKHRERWTHEKEEVRNMRYVTEMSATCDKAVKPHFRRELTTPTQVSYK